ncbi:MAG: DUF5606 domain-containing protein [Bacteroidales bacterium]|jgi:hypothetical protein|nr:DUF5606 domain-containing protein [Bacteroidales bacterium]MBR0539634.1 DUF5606 domain-containing protein [Bacteroidales bacterium]MBR3730483.1 DUF5606 domain-containing protein [Bacteroidales bacterium]MBR6227923.1 DUF5606 domain-containing protein [Bacteroidales bacterium]MDO5316940.1 DUF5606 domain-containing protein [bacterium]
MDLSKIVSISGKPGLYVIKSQAIGRLIVESVIDGKCSPAFARDRMSSLEEISIFSTDEDRPLKDVFKMIHEKMGDKVDFDYKKAAPEQLREKFAFVMPDYDEEAVYPSDMKKVFAWYQMLMDKNLLDFTEEEEKKEETPEQPAEKAE